MKISTDTLEASRVVALWAHIMDERAWHRLGECLTDDCVWNASVFGFESVTGLEAITAVLSAEGHARAHHTTNIVVSRGPAGELRARSKALGGMVDGTVVSAVYADGLRRTAEGWRISERVIHVVK
ncbi:nuclear transport factor 2 family protein [Streptomyces sp. NPDC046862]|uniref:nuclear transport factor 2 family protein n=1 Tax=Streptomyces sp. NPDC046862 TaxID=3154603 RepID=UPI0034535363